MKPISAELDALLLERFGQDCILALATTAEGVPHVRQVNTFYQEGAFYVLTHALSGKMQQIRRNRTVALAGDWFTAHGTAQNLGWFGKEENRAVAQAMQQHFAAWIGNGHNDFSDPNTVILRIALTDGVLFSKGTRYEL